MNRILLSLIIIIISINAYSNENYLQNKIVLYPYKQSEIAPIVDSTIIKYNFIVGQKFKKNDILVLLDNKVYKQNQIKSRAEVVRTQESFKYLNKIYKNNQKLYKGNAIGEQELEESKLNMVKALADNEQARANFEVAKIKLDACKIRAPFAGRIIDEIENEYDFIREGQPILKIVDDNQLLAVLNFPSNTINKIKIGDALTFKIDEINQEVSGNVYSISGSINPGSRTFEVKTLIDNKKGLLKVGMSGTLVSDLLVQP